MQEYYESPEFRGKAFTLDEFIEYWAINYGNGAFTYPSVWDGFNIPFPIVEEWSTKCEEAYGELRDKEIELLKAIREENVKNGHDYTYLQDSYIIGVHSKSKDLKEVIDHEVAHALHYIYNGYRESCEKLLETVPKSTIKRVGRTLTKMGYGQNIIKDEMQAYFSTEGYVHEGIRGRKEFEKNFRKFKKGLKKN